MSFQVLNWEEGRLVDLPATNAVTFVKGNALTITSGLVTNAAADQNIDVMYIADEGKLTTTTGELIRCYKIGPSVRLRADCEDAPAQTDVGTFCDLAAAGSLDPNSVTDQLFFIESIDLTEGAVGTSTVVTGYFQNGTPNA